MSHPNQSEQTYSPYEILSHSLGNENIDSLNIEVKSQSSLEIMKLREELNKLYKHDSAEITSLPNSHRFKETDMPAFGVQPPDQKTIDKCLNN